MELLHFLWRLIMLVHAYVWQGPKAIQSLATGLNTGPFSGTSTPLIRAYPSRLKAVAPWQLCNEGGWGCKIEHICGKLCLSHLSFYCKQWNCQNRNLFPLLSFQMVIMWMIHHFYLMWWVVIERWTLLSLLARALLSPSAIGSGTY